MTALYIFLIVFAIVILIAFILLLIFSIKQNKKKKSDKQKDITNVKRIDRNPVNKRPIIRKSINRTPINRIPVTPLNEIRGFEGETLIKSNLLSLLRDDEYYLTNLLFPLSSGSKTEIDGVLISRKGIFCIEIKNWIGHIIGDDNSIKWTQKYDDYYMSNKMHPNPVKQNENHCEILDELLNKEYVINNIVLFLTLEDRSNLHSDYTFDLDEFIEYYNGLDDVLDEYDLDKVKDKLEWYKASKEKIEEHKQQVRNKYHDY